MSPGLQAHPDQQQHDGELVGDVFEDWLHNEYVVNRNNLTALARQRGITIDHIILLARSWDIPIRPGGAHHNDIADLDLPQPPSPTMQKITMRRYAPRPAAAHDEHPRPSSSSAAKSACPCPHRIVGSWPRLHQQFGANAVGFLVIDRSTKEARSR
jgi:hypothetical protein